MPNVIPLARCIHFGAMVYLVHVRLTGVLYVQLADAKRDTWGYKPCEDRKYYSAIANSVSYGGDSYGNPRNLMLTAKYGF